MNKIHHRRSLTRTHTAHVVTRALSAEPVCRLCQLIINEINSRVRPGARKISWSRSPPGNLPVFRRASPPLNILNWFFAAFLLCIITGAAVPATISSYCCSIPFTLNGNLYYSCTDNGSSVGCIYGDRKWKQCRQPAGDVLQRKIAVNFVWKSVRRP